MPVVARAMAGFLARWNCTMATPLEEEPLEVPGDGVLIGAACAWAAARLVRAQLYGIAPGDPRTLLAAAAILLATALAASLAEIPDGPTKMQGIHYGERAADRLIELRARGK